MSDIHFEEVRIGNHYIGMIAQHPDTKLWSATWNMVPRLNDKDAYQFDNKDAAVLHLKKQHETPEEWEKRHEGHMTEEWTPERPFESRSLYCHDCKEDAAWKGNRKKSR